MERHTSFKILLIQLLLLPLLFFRGTACGEAQADDGETAWLTLSTHDVELVASKHENATVFLLLRGTISECININFTYDPTDPSIVPLNNFVICPDLFPALSTASPSPSPLKGCRGCQEGSEEETWEDVSSQPPKSPPSLLLLLQRWMYGVGNRRPEFSGSGEVVANVSVEVVSRWVGKTILGVTTNCSNVGVTDAFVRASVIRTRALDVASDVVGWAYTVLWDISFMPQLVLNWHRKSVEGFSLDNVAFNIIAYFYYSLFNIAFYWFPFIKDQFKERYPRTVNHVQLNDIIFATYALTVEFVYAIQGYMYGKKEGMRVSKLCVVLVGLAVLAVGVDCVLAAVGVVWWLDVFYLMSYMKLGITPLKYIPQVYVIYKVKSTKGFSIAGSVLDFSGGLLSLAQMFLLSANSNDYLSMFTDFSKFGLGVVTLFFDIIYFWQYWYFDFRSRNKET